MNSPTPRTPEDQLESNTTAAAMEAAGVQEAGRSTPPYTADNGDCKSVAAASHSRALGCVHEGFYYCKHCGLDLTPDIAPFTGTYGDGPNCARSIG